MSEKNLEQLQETHSEMLATAGDLGLKVPEELKADFTEVQAGQTILSTLDTLIREHSEKGLANDDGKGQSAPATTSSSPKRTKKSDAVRTPSTPKRTKKSAPEQADTVANPADVDPPKQESPVAAAKKSTKKVAKKASKSAKKSTSKSASANARTRSNFDEKSKIVKTGKENPAREKSGKYLRIDNVLKHNGKTVATYLGSGKGKTGTLSACVKLGLVKVA